MTVPAPFRIRHMALPATDIAASVRFFRTFGFEPGFAKFDAHGEPSLQQMGDGTCFVELVRTETIAEPSGWHLGLSVDDLPSAIERLAADGLFPIGPPRRGISGVDYVFFSDPSGNLVEITAAVP